MCGLLALVCDPSAVVTGETVDERQVMYQLGPSDREVFARAASGGAPYAVIDNCPLSL